MLLRRLTFPLLLFSGLRGRRSGDPFIRLPKYMNSQRNFPVDPVVGMVASQRRSANAWLRSMADVLRRILFLS